MNMHMCFWFGTDVGTLLIKGLRVTGTAGVLSICGGLIAIAMIFEAIRVYQLNVQQKVREIIRTEHCHSSTCSTDATPLLETVKVSKIYSSRWLMVLCQTGLFSVQYILSYILMLCVMTFNGYLSLAVVVGGGIGYLVFGQSLVDIAMKNSVYPGLKKECQACKDAIRRENERTGGSRDSLTNAAEGIVHYVVPPVQNRELQQENTCHTSVEIHQVDI